MKVLHVCPCYEPAWEFGGIPRGISSLCRGLASLGVDVTVYTTNADGKGGRLEVPRGRPVDCGGATVWYFDPTVTFGEKLVWDSRALARRCWGTMGDFDLLYIEAVWQWIGMSALRAGVARGVPVIMSTHGSLDRNLLGKSRLKKLMYWHLLLRNGLKRSSAVHFTTEYERQQSIRMDSGIQSFVVPSPVSLSEFRRDARLGRDFRRGNGIPLNAKVVLSVGRIDPKKRIDLTIRAIAPIMKGDKGVYLVIAGPRRGSYAARLVELAGELRISSRVLWTGALYGEALRSAYSSGNVLALMSEGENMGLAVVEAMSAEVPVLISNRVGVFPQVEAAKAGVVVGLNVGEASTAFERMLSHEDELRRMGKRARTCVEEHFSVESVAQRMLMAYEDVLYGTRRPECNWA